MSSGPQTAAASPATPAADPRSPEPPSALCEPSAETGSTPAAQQHPPSNPQQQEQPAKGAQDAEAYEAQHVHTVYEAIAPHFSSTRYKPWPLVSSFLLSLPPGSVGLDAGCGNGKYIAVNPALYIIASDRSANLVSLARNYRAPVLDGVKNKKKSNGAAAGHNYPSPSPPAVPSPGNQVLVADSLALPYRPSSFDFAISIAVVHHLSTRTRRRDAVAALLDAVRPREGRVLVYVWALEQGGSRRGWDAGADQDQLVPWVTKGKAQPEQRPQDATYQRYYHLYREGELEEDVVAVGGRVLDSGYEKDNWWAICCKDA